MFGDPHVYPGVYQAVCEWKEPRRNLSKMKEHQAGLHSHLINSGSSGKFGIRSHSAIPAGPQWLDVARVLL